MRIVIVIAAVVGILAILIAVMNVMPQSIGIIGGADGPTAIFVAAKFNYWGIFLLIACILIIVVVVLLIITRKR